MTLKMLLFGILVLKGTLLGLSLRNKMFSIPLNIFLKWGHLSCLVTTLCYAYVAKLRFLLLGFSPK